MRRNLITRAQGLKKAVIIPSSTISDAALISIAGSNPAAWHWFNPFPSGPNPATTLVQ
ncbi:hypothetical protein BC629DRAFT_1466222 [Irpex lacteus]|nr:hypothetical protein BC629DRAFT_1466222 [Irpex lacteus]